MLITWNCSASRPITSQTRSWIAESHRMVTRRLGFATNKYSMPEDKKSRAKRASFLGESQLKWKCWLKVKSWASSHMRWKPPLRKFWFGTRQVETNRWTRLGNRRGMKSVADKLGVGMIRWTWADLAFSQKQSKRRKGLENWWTEPKLEFGPLTLRKTVGTVRARERQRACLFNVMVYVRKNWQPWSWDLEWWIKYGLKRSGVEELDDGRAVYRHRENITTASSRPFNNMKSPYFSITDFRNDIYNHLKLLIFSELHKCAARMRFLWTSWEPQHLV